MPTHSTGEPTIEPLNQRRRPYIIAEIGANHEGSLTYAKKLLEDAVSAGADAVKFQTYTPDRIVNKLVAPERHKHFGKFALTPENYIELANICKSHNVSFMSSIWDIESIRLLDPFIHIHKVGSGDLTNYRLLKILAEIGKPLCIATAMSSLREIQDAVSFIRETNPQLVASGNVCLLHCVAMYGNPRDEYANLQSISTLQDAFAPEIAIGYSDHTMGGVAAMIAASMGASVIETHFTDDNTREFRDHHFAHTRDMLTDLVTFCKRRDLMLGAPGKQPIAVVETNKRIWEFRRAVYFVKDMNAGEVATEDNLTTLRPSEGIPANRYFDVIGMRLAHPKRALEPVSWGDFEGAF